MSVLVHHPGDDTSLHTDSKDLTSNTSELPGVSQHSTISTLGAKTLRRNSTFRDRAAYKPPTADVLPEVAATKFMQLSRASVKSRRELQDSEEIDLPPWVIHPQDKNFQWWWWFTIAAAVVTLWFEPYGLAFSEYPGLYPMNSADSVISIVLLVVFTVDMALSFFVAYYDKTHWLETDLQKIAIHYCRTRLWADVLTTVPFDYVVLACLGLQESNSQLARYISLLRLLRLGRAYRLFILVAFLEYNTAINYVTVTLVRNYTIIFFTIHFAACGFYYIALQQGFSAASWVAQSTAAFNFDELTQFDKYIMSLYWSIVTFATVGYGDLHAYTVPEAVFSIAYIMINVGIAAYLVGTMTLLIVKHDEKTGSYRDKMCNLDTYSSTKKFPKDLTESMKGHLQLHFSSDEASDEQVLAIYPTTIRRRILRHLYLEPLRACWLFKGCRQKFMDALLASARVELFMPKVEIIAEGDHVLELFVVLGGYVMPNAARVAAGEDLTLDNDDRSVYAGGKFRGMLGPGEVFGEIPFFTETPTLQGITSNTISRVLVVSRAVYRMLAADFPISTRTVLENLQQRAEMAVEGEFSTQQLLRSRSNHVVGVGSSGSVIEGMGLAWAAPELVDDRGTTHDQASAFCPAASNFTPEQQQSLANLLRIRTLVRYHTAKVDVERTNEFLQAASSGDAERVKSMLQQGFNVNAVDYDNRSALMLAADKGHLLVLELLLNAGCDPTLVDSLGNTAMSEACTRGHDAIIDALLRRRAPLGKTGGALAAQLCSAVHEGDVPLLRRLLTAGADADAADYDLRTALHIAASDGHVASVRTLVEEGGATIQFRDRWGNTALDEALRTGAAPVVDYLRSQLPPDVASEAMAKFELTRTQELLKASSKGDVEVVRELLRRGCPPDSADYDGRQALMLAAAAGQEEVAAVLLAAGGNACATDKFGGTALLEAVNAGHDSMIQLLLKGGAGLHLPAARLSVMLCNMVMSNDLARLKRFITAGANVNVGDYDKRTALHIAAAEGNLKALKLLVEEGEADLLVRDRWDATPLDEARRMGVAAVVEYLEEMMVRVDVAVSQARSQERLAYLLLCAAARGDVAGVREMLVHDCPPDIADYDARTALMVASGAGHRAVVELLLAGGANGALRDKFGNTALLEACRGGQDEMVDLLRERGLKAGLSGMAAASRLCTAVHDDDLALLRRYLRAGADANAADYDKRTALHVAASNGNLAAVQVLVEVGGADVSASDRWGHTALDDAQRCGAERVLDYLSARLPK